MLGFARGTDFSQDVGPIGKPYEHTTHDLNPSGFLPEGSWEALGHYWRGPLGHQAPAHPTSARSLPTTKPHFRSLPCTPHPTLPSPYNPPDTNPSPPHAPQGFRLLSHLPSKHHCTPHSNPPFPSRRQRLGSTRRVAGWRRPNRPIGWRSRRAPKKGVSLDLVGT